MSAGHQHVWTERPDLAAPNEVVWRCDCGEERWVRFDPDGTTEYSPSFIEEDAPR